MTDFPSGRRVDVGELALSVHDAGEGPAVVMCHGFPELAYSWRHQFPALVGAGFRAIAPDQRGYGGSDAPRRVEDYDLLKLSGDLVGLLDALEIEKAVFSGHDWGGFVAWAMPVLHPDRCLGMIGVNTPYIAFPTTDTLRAAFPDPEKLYMLWFQEVGVAEGIIDRRPRLVFEKLMRCAYEPVAASLQEIPDANPFRDLEGMELRGEAMLSEHELDVYARAFEKSGFFGPLSWYRNIDRNKQLVPDMGVAKLELPCLQIMAEWDAAIPPAAAAGMPSLCSDLEMHTIPRCGHWTQQDKPDELNRLMVDWLRRRFPESK